MATLGVERTEVGEIVRIETEHRPKAYIWTAGTDATGSFVRPYIRKDLEDMTEQSRQAIEQFVQASKDKLAEIGDCLALEHHIREGIIWGDERDNVINPLLVLSERPDFYIAFLPYHQVDLANPLNNSDVLLSTKDPRDSISASDLLSLNSLQLRPLSRTVRFVGRFGGMNSATVSLMRRDYKTKIPSTQIAVRVEGLVPAPGIHPR